MQLIDSQKFLGYIKLARSVKLSIYKHACAQNRPIGTRPRIDL